MLRQEVYALDGTAKEPHPYTVTEQNFTIRLLQPQGGNRHAVFFTHPREAISYHYERNPADPRISHALTLEVDAFGNVLQVGCHRLRPPPARSDAALAGGSGQADHRRSSPTPRTASPTPIDDAPTRTTTARRCRARRAPTS